MRVSKVTILKIIRLPQKINTICSRSRLRSLWSKMQFASEINENIMQNPHKIIVLGIIKVCVCREMDKVFFIYNFLDDGCAYDFSSYFFLKIYDHVEKCLRAFKC